ncbi:SDR family NAD(P)-dependent oxidoreductase [Temperatibacter marinus]|uniref:SDR family NAD(P)-dependent oxidoreductase n=1 Tax=Temperatibacter marinus TaxID=1456591 RepID=A0AA52H8U3_9PROT|nr:SDR family NAD(P)-dependent oxidoreductase [Temperatibacter marinus]WND01822.1 SDR family NAD(P)-dependent oxidoreductase [Temperatibacter marinus]
MDILNKCIVITGGASGIGIGLAKQAMEEGASKVVLLDIDEAQASKVAQEIGAVAYALDVTDEDAIKEVIEDIEKSHGPIDLFFSNAGVMFPDYPDFNAYDLSNEKWELSWQVNVMAHVYISRILFPLYKKRGAGGFVITASAAGLLNQIGTASYGVTKHAAVGMAENMAFTHNDEGIYVGCICPQAVESNMLGDHTESVAAMDGILSAEEMAKRAFKGIKEDHFMIRPHGVVVQYFQQKAANYDRWVGGMRKLRRMQIAKTGTPV